MIQQEFKNKPAILIATGPSLTEEVVETVRKYKKDYVIFGCNNAYEVVDFLDIHYACDKKWWDVHNRPLKKEFPNLRTYTQDEAAAKVYNLSHVAGQYKAGLSTDSSKIHFGSNSGYQLLNLAFLFGCNKFILVGYNMQKVSGKAHFFGDHPPDLKSNSPYTKFVQAFNNIQAELKPLIVNCTPDSALTMFRFNQLEDELQCG